MYSTCLHCTKSLGTNQVLETLPIGRRVAFDAEKGRLWAICPHCAKWNLVPFDTRLETIDACERLFRDTRTRYSTGSIGMARLGEGLELVRIGAALRPEYAAWRYGRELLRGRRPAAGDAGGTGIGVVGRFARVLEAAQTLLALPFLETGVTPRQAVRAARLVRDPATGHLVRVREVSLVQSVLHRDPSGWRLEVPYRTGLEPMLGDDPLYSSSIRDHPAVGFFQGQALHVGLGRILPAFERGVPKAELVREATRIVEKSFGEPEGLLAYVAGRPLRFETRREFPLKDAAPEVRLALEMVAHEEVEREALAGELKLLEREWREAEGLAKISDALVLSQPRSAIGDPRSEDAPSDL